MSTTSPLSPLVGLTGSVNTPPSPILELTGIVKTFPGVRALDEAGLRVYPGQVMALLGENGAGKSTLMKVLTGIYQADAGSVSYRGQPVHFKGPRDSQDQGISIIHQELNLLPELSIAANIFLGREPRTRFGNIDHKQLRERASTLLARLGELTQDDAAVIVADLIFGLPGQDDAVWRQDIADVMASGVHGVDLYQLIPMAGTNLERAEASGKLGWAADGQQRAAMYAYGAQTLEQGGWQRLSCSHWRRGDAEQSRYNQMAKRGAEILPFGAGAGGNVHGHGLMYGRDLALWHEALADGVRAPGMVMGQNPNAPMDGLLRGALDSGRLTLDRLPAPLRAHLLPLFQAWQLHGLAALTEDTLVLTLAGRFWNVNLQAGLFEFLQLNLLGGVQSAVHSTEAVRHSLV